MGASVTFAEDWLRRARARHRARMVAYVEQAAAARLAGSYSRAKLTAAEMRAELAAHPLNNRIVIETPPRHGKTRAARGALLAAGLLGAFRGR